MEAQSVHRNCARFAAGRRHRHCENSVFAPDCAAASMAAVASLAAPVHGLHAETRPSITSGPRPDGNQTSPRSSSIVEYLEYALSRASGRAVAAAPRSAGDLVDSGDELTISVPIWSAVHGDGWGEAEARDKAKLRRHEAPEMRPGDAPRSPVSKNDDPRRISRRSGPQCRDAGGGRTVAGHPGPEQRANSRKQQERSGVAAIAGQARWSWLSSCARPDHHQHHTAPLPAGNMRRRWCSISKHEEAQIVSRSCSARQVAVELHVPGSVETGGPDASGSKHLVGEPSSTRQP